jgi:hypothetical protein
MNGWKGDWHARIMGFCLVVLMDGRVPEWMAGGMDGWLDEWMDGRLDG